MSINNRRNAALGYLVTKVVFPMAKKQVKRKVSSTLDPRQRSSSNGNGSGNGRAHALRGRKQTEESGSAVARDASLAVGAVLGLVFFLARRKRG